MNTFKVLIFALIVCSKAVKAQDSLQHAHIDYTLTAETAVGTGHHTSFLLAANRHHVLSTRQNTAYLRGVLNFEHPFNKYLTLTAGIDAIASVHANHSTYLQQCFANLQWKDFFVEIGSRDTKPILRHDALSSGAFTLGNNAKPIPQARFGTDGFWTVPFTRGWLQLNFGFGYGKFLDSSDRESRFYQAQPGVNEAYSTGAYYHQKHLYFRINPNKHFFFIAGIEHAVQFAGTSHKWINDKLLVKKKSASLKSFFDVILPLGDSNYFEHEAGEDWVFGNHLGSMTVQVGWNIDKEHTVQAYLDNIFEDGSGIRKSNGFDGLWGLQYSNKSTELQLVRGAVVEYLQTTNQCGPLHWDSGDYPEPIRSQITDYVTGNDNYYNHSYYAGYSHYGMTPGNPLITSPIYNKEGQNAFIDTRIKAWHLGVNGEFTNQTSYLLKASYRKGWGTYHQPLPEKSHSFSTLLQGSYHLNQWKFSVACAFDIGNTYGNSSTFNIKIGYHGKLL